MLKIALEKSSSSGIEEYLNKEYMSAYRLTDIYPLNISIKLDYEKLKVENKLSKDLLNEFKIMKNVKNIDEFKENMDMEQFKENCPLLFEFFTQAEEGGLGHYQFYETVFDMAWDDEVNLIEDDATITINVDGADVVEQQKIADFLGETEWVDQEEDPKTVKITKAFWTKHREDFGIHQDVDEFTTYKAKNGVIQLSEWISPKGLANYQTRERNVTVEHDNIVDLDFYIEADDFDLSKLGFLLFANATDFHKSAPEYVGSYLFYDNNIIRPDMNIHGDKGFSLDYEFGFKSCNFLVEG